MAISGDIANMVCVGAIAGAFGVRGEVKVKSFCGEPEAIASYGPLSTEAGASFKIRITRPVKGGFAARLSDVPTREAAEALKGTRLYAPRARLPEPGEDEFYHADLIDMEVVDTGGALLGRVRAVFDHGAGDILDVVGDTALLIPFTREAVPTIDIGARRIVADLPGEITAEPEADG